MCNENLKHAPIMPIAAKPSQYGIDPSLVKRRVAELPGMCSLRLAELFPELPPVIYPGGQDALDKLYQVAMEELRKVDMSFIKPGQSVNILASHHGFTLLGGQPYAILIKATRDAIIEKTGCKDVRLRAGVGMRFRETEEYIRRYQLDEYFGPGKTKGVAPIDEGIPIETEVGTLYGIKAVYDADWIVHCHHTDVREVHFHRQVDQSGQALRHVLCPHRDPLHLPSEPGPPGRNFTARAIFESPFVQSKFAFASFLNVGPHGVIGVDADNDLYAVNDGPPLLAASFMER